MNTVVSVHEQISEFARLYGVRVVVRSRKYADGVLSPQGEMSLSIRNRAVAILGVLEDQQPAALFHEVIHAILGPPGLKLCEGFVLLPFEWEAAKWVERRLSPHDQQPFLRAVDKYQCVTEVVADIEYTDIFDGDRTRRWWRAGLQRAQTLGLLDRRNQLTFQRPDWRKLQMSRAENWTMADDEGTPWATTSNPST